MSAQALFWFGRVTSTDTYADVRMGFNDTELYVRIAVIDRRLWYNATNPAPGNLTDWDSVSLFVSTDGNTGAAPTTHTFRFDAQPNWWEPRANYQAAYRGTVSGWTTANIPFITQSSWRGNALNDDVDDNGWVMEYHIPFASLGLSMPPAMSSAAWGLGFIIHNRDDAAGTPLPIQTWPEFLNKDMPGTWGQLRFGLPTYAPPATNPGQWVTIRSGPGITVTDDAVGGRFMCGDGLDIWSQWGNANYAGEDTFNIQNEADISDLPCFSKYYVTFPLASLPTNKVILSTTLTLHQFGQAGAPGAAHYSLIQVSTVAEDWTESTLNWNNAPLALENVGQALVDPAPQPCDWPCVPREWNVTYAAAQAYATNQPLRLVLYSGDPFYHSGKYFVSSDAEDWNAVARPTLHVLLGDPQ